MIFVRDTVKDLLPFLYSLLDHSPCHFRLVSNACSLEEEELLQKQVEGQERLSFYRVNTRHMLEHHLVLHDLLTLDDDEWFAFIDSDILATGDFMKPLMTAASQCDAVFTGLPLWHEASEQVMPADFMVMGGRYYQSPDGHSLGLSYCAMYRRQPMLRYMQESGIDFRRFYWSAIPEKYQHQLQEAGLRKIYYDTAKVFNILWQQWGAKCRYVEVPELLHLGGISGPGTQKKQRGLSLFRFYKHLRFARNIKEALNLNYLVKKRNIAAQMLSMVIHDASFDESHPMLRVLSPSLKKKLSEAAVTIAGTYRKYHKQIR